MSVFISHLRICNNWEISLKIALQLQNAVTIKFFQMQALTTPYFGFY